MMYEVNRSIALIRPRAPFLDWLKSLPGEANDSITLDSLRRDCNALLIPAAEDFDEAVEFIAERAEELFAAELADWCEDDGLWPELSAALFAEWFEVEIHSVLTDLVEEELEREPFQPFELDE